MIPNEKYRPRLHFSPRAGWINDPNGLIRVDGVWHAFYQHDPGSTLHGPMHWGHATSTDLAHWQEQPLALYPNELGACFSGSAIETPEGVKLFYTAHRRIDGRDHQTQCLVHADRGLTSFVSDPGNPVIDNPGIEAFRDPKVIWHAATASWIMVVTHGQSIGIHSSPDLRHWRLESTFGETEGRHSDGPWECPDLFPLTAPDGSEHWVLVVGIGTGAYGAGSGTQYFIGTFDGQKFMNLNQPNVELWLDYGRDFYAAQSFGASAEAPVVLAWASNWLYARQTPTVAFRGALSLPRTLRLVETADGLRLAGAVPEQVAAEFDHFRLGDAPLVPRTGTYRLSGTIRLQPGQVCRVALFGETAPQFTFERDASGQTVLALRRGAIDGMDQFAHQYDVPLGPVDEFDVELFADNGIVELAVDGGRVWATNLYFPEDVAGRVTVERVAVPAVAVEA